MEWVPVCPEVEAGFATPREAMRLARVGKETRLITVKTGRDVTPALNDFIRRRVPLIAADGLSGASSRRDRRAAVSSASESTIATARRRRPDAAFLQTRS